MSETHTIDMIETYVYDYIQTRSLYFGFNAFSEHPK